MGERSGLPMLDRARAELSLAQKSLPNDPLAFQLAGFIDRRHEHSRRSSEASSIPLRDLDEPFLNEL
jgi:hypothetical protein